MPLDVLPVSTEPFQSPRVKRTLGHNPSLAKDEPNLSVFPGDSYIERERHSDSYSYTVSIESANGRLSNLDIGKAGGERSVNAQN